MKFLTFEQLADRWTLAHTVALAAWVVALVLGAQLFFRHVLSAYPATTKMKIYAGENATFMYPENWIINGCGTAKAFIELPGTIKSEFKGRQAYAFILQGSGQYECITDRPERFDIYSEEIVASDHPCAIATSTPGERLQNGLYLQLDEQDDAVLRLHIRQNACFAPPSTSILSFTFVDTDQGSNDIAKHGQPRVKKDDLLASRQYRDIKTLAESIRY